MATIDQRFICTSDLDTYYVDQSSGEPMSGGIVTFYSDVNRTTLKPVYQLTGTPGNYTYAPLPNPCVLSSSGTFQDGNGNNIVPYYYPFTGTPDQNTGVQELYYITVVNSGFVPQFTRQGWPQSAAAKVEPLIAQVDNLIPNGQFIANNNAIAQLGVNVPPYAQYTFGAETVNAQPIAQGGWNFVYDNGTTSTFNNSFSLIPASGGWGLPSYPRYVFNFICTSNITPPTTQDLRIQWRDIYKFSAGGFTFNFFFNAKSNDNNTYTFTLYQIFYYGSGGSPSSPIVNQIGTININGSYQNYNFNITFPFAPGTLGTNGDDYVALSIRGPSSSYNVQFSDFVMYQGDVALTLFPVDTNAQMLSQGVAGWMPAPNNSGQDLYLPLILTPDGMTFDHSQIGKIVASTTNPKNNELLCDGSMYITNAYSGLGIPYSRLQSIWFNSTTNQPLFGTGKQFAQIAINSGATSQMILGTNNAGTLTANPADGAINTGFNFTLTPPLSNQGHATYNYNAYSNQMGVVTAISTFSTSVNAVATAGTSGMQLTTYSQGSGAELYVFGITALAASALSAGSGLNALYFTFSNHTTSFYVWFFVNNENDPAPGGTGIKCNLISTMGVVDVANVIARVLSGQQTNAITTIAASSIPAGSWFNFYANNSTEYSVWYQKAGLPSSTPVVPGIPIKVSLSGSETAAQVATATQIAVNSYSFAVPDLRGVFLRGTDPNLNWDLDLNQRWFANNTAGGLSQSSPGSFEYDQILSHFHIPFSIQTTFWGSGNGAGGVTNTGIYGGATQTANYGGTESRPINMAVNWLVKY